MSVALKDWLALDTGWRALAGRWIRRCQRRALGRLPIADPCCSLWRRGRVRPHARGNGARRPHPWRTDGRPYL